MCTVNVAPHAEQVLAALVADMRAALAAEQGCQPDELIISGVDFGTELETSHA